MSHPIQNKIIVTGATGFIGSALTWQLNNLGHNNIIAVDLLDTSDKFKNLVPLRFSDYIEADEFHDLFSKNPKHFGKIDFVYHLGACSATTETDCRYLIQNNYEYTKSICRWALGEKARFVYASSAATYGDGTHGMDDKDPNLHRLRPLNMYGYSKHLFDLYAHQQGFLNDIVGLKYFNVFGPNEGHKADMRSLVHKAYHQILETGSVKLFKSNRPDYKDGEQKRDFLYVKDAVDMTIHLANKKDVGGLYNIGSGEANTWLTLATALFEAMGKPVKIEFIEMPEHLKSKYQYYTCADTTKLRSTGYSQPIRPLKESVKDYVQNYLAVGRYLGDE